MMYLMLGALVVAIGLVLFSMLVIASWAEDWMDRRRKEWEDDRNNVRGED